MSNTWAQVTQCDMKFSKHCYTINPMVFMDPCDVDDKTDYIYALGFYEAGQFTPIYIGHSTDIGQRVKAHLHNARVKQSFKDRVIFKLLQEQKEIVLRPIKPVEREDDEELCIDNYEGAGFVLLNEKRGDDGVKRTKGPKKDWIEKEWESFSRR